jgi:flagellar biosynthesis component FlhA
VRSLRRYQDQLLTFLDWAAEMLAPFHQMLEAHIPDLVQRQHFIRTVARCWRLRQALINGQRSRKRQTAQAEAVLQELLGENETFSALATYLMNILDAAGHTSSLIECINGLLKMFLHNRRAFRNRDTAQAYLNLFVLWHNMRVYERGKRQGKSPYQWASIDAGTVDWLALLGYPAAN